MKEVGKWSFPKTREEATESFRTVLKEARERTDELRKTWLLHKVRG